MAKYLAWLNKQCSTTVVVKSPGELLSLFSKDDQPPLPLRRNRISLDNLAFSSVAITVTSFSIYNGHNDGYFPVMVFYFAFIHITYLQHSMITSPYFSISLVLSMSFNFISTCFTPLHQPLVIGLPNNNFYSY